MNYFAIIPLYGTIILLIWLFIKGLKNEIRMHKFMGYFFVCAFVGSLLFCLPLFTLAYVSSLVTTVRLMKYCFIPTFILSGYLMNLFVFIFINKKWQNFWKGQLQQ